MITKLKIKFECHKETTSVLRLKLVVNKYFQIISYVHNTNKQTKTNMCTYIYIFLTQNIVLGGLSFKVSDSKKHAL